MIRTSCLYISTLLMLSSYTPFLEASFLLKENNESRTSKIDRSKPYLLGGKVRMPIGGSARSQRSPSDSASDDDIPPSLPVDSSESVAIRHQLDLSNPQSQATVDLIRALKTASLLRDSNKEQAILKKAWIKTALAAIKRKGDANVTMYIDRNNVCELFSPLSFAIENKFSSELILSLLERGAVLNATNYPLSQEKKNALFSWFDGYSHLLELGWTWHHDSSQSKPEQIARAIRIQNEIRDSACVLGLLLRYSTDQQDTTSDFVENIRSLAQSNANRTIYSPDCPWLNDYINRAQKSRAEEEHCALYKKCKNGFLKLLTEANVGLLSSQDPESLQLEWRKGKVFNMRVDTIGYFLRHRDMICEDASTLKKLFSFSQPNAMELPEDESKESAREGDAEISGSEEDF